MRDSYFYETGKEERELAERIAELEQQLTEARAEIERLRKPVTIRCSYCNEIICTEAEWNDKVPDHMVSCPKNPARIFALENERLKAPMSDEESILFEDVFENSGGNEASEWHRDAFDAVTAARAAGCKG